MIWDRGGAEKVLVNLVNNMDSSKFDITVMTLFDIGENRQFLGEKVRYKTWCKKMVPGNSHLMKILSPEYLHKIIVKEHYDIEVAYLEGPCARVISGCSDSKVKSWHGYTSNSILQNMQRLLLEMWQKQRSVIDGLIELFVFPKQ